MVSDNFLCKVNGHIMFVGKLSGRIKKILDERNEIKKKREGM